MDLYVAYLNSELNEDGLLKLFEVFGKVNSVILVRDKETGKSKGYGFVNMPDEHEAAQAIESLNGRTIADRPIIVREANPKSTSTNHNQQSNQTKHNYPIQTEQNSYEEITSAINKRAAEDSMKTADKLSFETFPIENGLVKVKFN